MKKFIFVFMLIPVFAFADVRVSKQVSTGKIIAMQSSATPGTLTRNAISAGYQETDVKEVVMTEAEYSAAMKAREWGNDLALAKARRVKEIKKEARRIMTDNTDWYVIRKAETGTAIPAPIQTYRAALRQATNDAEAAINALATIDAVRDYKPTWPDAPGE